MRSPSRAVTFLPFLGLLPLPLGLALLSGCGAPAATFVRANDTTLGRVVVYRNGVAYFERTAIVEGDHLTLKVPGEKLDDFLKSLTVVDAQTGEPAPISYPTKLPSSETGLLEMNIGLSGPTTHQLRLSYVTEAPSWKPSYRVVLGENGKVELDAWAIVDNTSGEDWTQVKLGVGSSSALSFRFDLQSVRLVERETLHQNDLLALAPPVGGASYGGEPAQKKLVAELDEGVLAVADAPPPAPPAAASAAQSVVVSKEARGHGKSGGRASAPAAPQVPLRELASDYGGSNNAGAGVSAGDSLARMAAGLKSSPDQVIIEGFATRDDADKQAASLERANKVREQLLRKGVDPNKVVAVGRGEQAGRNGGVRVVQAPAPAEREREKDGKAHDNKEAAAAEPIGTSHFESGTTTTVARGTSAMVSILKNQTDGEVVYLYDPESTRGNARYPFKSVHLKNPSDSALETGPVTVFGEGHFIGEGMTEPIPARGSAFVPFALDRQLVVDQATGETDEISRILTVQRGVFSTEVQHKRKLTFTLNNRLNERAVVYVRHTVPAGYKLTKVPDGAGTEKIGSADLIRVVVLPHGKADVAIEETTPVFKTIDVRSPESIEQVRVFLSQAATRGPLKEQVEQLLRLNKELADIDQRITTTREQMVEYRARMDELHDQIFTLKAVRTAGPLMQSLEAKMQEISDRLSKATIEIVALQEKRMVARIHFQDGVADLSLDKSEKSSSRVPARHRWEGHWWTLAVETSATLLLPHSHRSWLDPLILESTSEPRRGSTSSTSSSEDAPPSRRGTCALRSTPAGSRRCRGAVAGGRGASECRCAAKRV